MLEEPGALEQVDVGRKRQADAAELKGQVLEQDLELDARKWVVYEEEGDSLPGLELGTTSWTDDVPESPLELQTAGTAAGVAAAAPAGNVAGVVELASAQEERRTRVGTCRSIHSEVDRSRMILARFEPEQSDPYPYGRHSPECCSVRHAAFARLGSRWLRPGRNWVAANNSRSTRSLLLASWSR